MDNRRDFLKSAGLLGLGAVATGLYHPANAYSREKAEMGPQNLDDFACTFRVNIFGRGWVSDNSQKIAETEFAELTKPVREHLVSPDGKPLVFPNGKDIVEFLTLDFEPKPLLGFDIKNGDKSVASNIREDNYSRVLLLRESGNMTYSFKITDPRHKEGYTIVQPFRLMNDSEVYNFADHEDSKNGSEKENWLVPIERFHGTYPRAFHFNPEREHMSTDTPKRFNVEYYVYGLESLAGSLAGANFSPEGFKEFWENRDRFNGNIKAYVDYKNDHKKGLDIHSDYKPE